MWIRGGGSANLNVYFKFKLHFFMMSLTGQQVVPATVAAPLTAPNRQDVRDIVTAPVTLIHKVAKSCVPTVVSPVPPFFDVGQSFTSRYPCPSK